MSSDASDGKSKNNESPIPSLEAIPLSSMDENTRPSPNHVHLGDHDCRTFAFIGGDKPHFIFSSMEGWGRFYVSNTQIALAVEDCSRHIGDVVRSGDSKRP